jgi:GT2 family glycosyltransferase
VHPLLWRYRRLRDRLLRPETTARRIYDRATWALKRQLDRVRPQPHEVSSYALWRERNEPRDEELQALRRRTDVAGVPLISVLMAAGEGSPRAFDRSVRSLARQVHADWQLRVAYNAGLPASSLRRLRRLAARDRRIELIAAAADDAWSAALRAAGGDFVLPLVPGDELAPDAIARLIEALAAEPQVDVIYPDEDELDDRGHRGNPFFKPDWSPDLLLSMNYIGGAFAARRTLVEAVGGFRHGLPGAEAYDLLLRLSERGPRILHLPRVLYHACTSRGARAMVGGVAAQRALTDALARRGREGTVVPSFPGAYRVRYRISGEPRVSIIIPTRDKISVLRTCIDSIVARSTWRSYELLIVDNGSSEPESLRYLDELRAHHRVIRDDRAFNWSALNNRAAEQASGDYLLFLNNDVEIITPDWLEAMLEHAQHPEVGAVGVQLLYPNDTIQHAGVVLGIGGPANHAFRHVARGSRGYCDLLAVVRNYSAVTGACMMTRRELFREVGGFDEQLPIVYNDVDFCLRLGRRGLFVVYTPFAELYHYESTTRGTLHPPADEAIARDRWAALIKNDPFYSPHLTLAREDFQLRL